MKVQVAILFLIWMLADAANINTIKDIEESDDEGSYPDNSTSAAHSRVQRAAGDPVTTSGEQYCILYNDISGTTGAQKLIKDYVPDLEELGWKDVISSTKCYGIWLFYQQKNFNPTGHGRTYRLSSSEAVHRKLEGSFADLDNQITSIRYAGPIEDPFLIDSITLYENDWNEGEEYFALEDIPNIPSRMNDRLSSVVITGMSDWRIYEHSEFRGKSYCLQHESDGSKYENKLSDIQMDNMVSSFKKGC